MKTEIYDDTVTVYEVCGCRASTHKFEPCTAHDISSLDDAAIKSYRDRCNFFVEAAVEAQQRHDRERLHHAIFKDRDPRE